MYDSVPHERKPHTIKTLVKNANMDIMIKYNYLKNFFKIIQLKYLNIKKTKLIIINYELLLILSKSKYQYDGLLCFSANFLNIIFLKID